MEIDFNSLDPEFESYESVYLEIASKVLSHLGLSFEPIISISLVNDETIHQINNDYRHIDRVTDVISFAFNDGENRESLYHSGSMVVLGDIYICIDQAKRQAEEYGHSLDREMRFLFVHGLLHLLGYDHMKKEDEEIMFPLQEEILAL
ncbi:MAG: rRNA maturation RNase YbeY [Bacilli bacterium]|nr:rRNA maturation RNase YbeY [Bacilli bacterium]MBO4682878.1 rRNA maturation RNase YbeY [Bacilli bacterium]